MKKLILLCCCILLIGCGPDIQGKWTNPDGLTEITFEGDSVIFFDVEGTYKVNGSKISLIFESMTLEYSYEIDGDELILYTEEDALRLERELE